MADPKIRIKRSAVAGKIPTADQVPLGEIALNTYDGKLFASKNVGIGTTVFVVNPWTVGAGTDAYNTYFTVGNVGIGSTLPSALLDVSGNVKISGIVTSVDGRLISGIGINTSGGNIGYGITTLDFRGSGISTITVSSGIATINIAGGGGGSTNVNRTTTTFVSYGGQTTFAVNYTANYIDVYFNGVRLTSSEYTALDGSSVILNEAANEGDVVDITAYGSDQNFYWSVGSGSTIYRNSYVGIGTTQALYTLDVGGDINFTGTFRQNGSPFIASRWTAGTGDNIYRLNGNVGIGTTNPTSKLSVQGDANVSGVITASNGFVGNLTGTATTATNLSNAANITTGTINASRLSGTYNIDISGNAATATYATTAGVSTYSTSAGIATYATTSGIATYASTAGVSTYSTSAGIATYATSSGISTSVIGGIGSISQLQVSGISTFSNGPVFVGSATSTGTASQPLQVTGGVYASGNVGIATTNPTEKLDVNGAIRARGGIKQSNSPFLEQINTVSEDYTISTNYNALSVGTIQINSGVTVTIPSGSNWTII